MDASLFGSWLRTKKAGEHYFLPGSDGALCGERSSPLTDAPPRPRTGKLDLADRCEACKAQNEARWKKVSHAG